MLRAVGNAVAVNPDTELAEVARDEGWQVMRFEKLGRRLTIACGNRDRSADRRGRRDVRPAAYSALTALGDLAYWAIPALREARILVARLAEPSVMSVFEGGSL